MITLIRFAGAHKEEIYMKLMGL